VTRWCIQTFVLLFPCPDRVGESSFFYHFDRSAICFFLFFTPRACRNPPSLQPPSPPLGPGQIAFLQQGRFFFLWLLQGEFPCCLHLFFFLLEAADQTVFFSEPCWFHLPHLSFLFFISFARVFVPPQISAGLLESASSTFFFLSYMGASLFFFFGHNFATSSPPPSRVVKFFLAFIASDFFFPRFSHQPHSESHTRFFLPHPLTQNPFFLVPHGASVFLFSPSFWSLKE